MFLIAAGALSWICLVLAPVAVALLVLYSYGKRFTDFPQVLLALAQFVAPVGAWLAVDRHRVAGRRSRSGIAVGTWIGGFDLIYSCQDAEIDRRIGSRSFPARFGIPAALRVSSVVHRGHARGVRVVRRCGRSRLAVVDSASALTGAVLVYEHAIVRERRPVPRQPGVLHRQRRHRHRPVRLRARRPDHPWTRRVTRPPWVVGVSGASGTPYARTVISALLDAGESLDLVVSRAARLTLLDEVGVSFRDNAWRD